MKYQLNISLLTFLLHTILGIERNLYTERKSYEFRKRSGNESLTDEDFEVNNHEELDMSSTPGDSESLFESPEETGSSSNYYPDLQSNYKFNVRPSAHDTKNSFDPLNDSNFKDIFRSSYSGNADENGMNEELSTKDNREKNNEEEILYENAKLRSKEDTEGLKRQNREEVKIFVSENEKTGDENENRKVDSDFEGDFLNNSINENFSKNGGKAADEGRLNDDPSQDFETLQEPKEYPQNNYFSHSDHEKKNSKKKFKHEDVFSLESELKDTASAIEYLHHRLREPKINSENFEYETVKPNKGFKNENRKKVIKNLKYILSPADSGISEESADTKERDLNEFEEKRGLERGNGFHKLKKHVKTGKQKDSETKLKTRVNEAKENLKLRQNFNDIQAKLKKKELYMENGRHKKYKSGEFNREVGELRKEKPMSRQLFNNKIHKLSKLYDFNEGIENEGENLDLTKDENDVENERTIQNIKSKKFKHESNSKTGKKKMRKDDEEDYENEMEEDSNSVEKGDENPEEEDNTEIDTKTSSGKHEYTWEGPKERQEHNSVKKDKPRRKIKSVGKRQFGQIFLGPMIKKVHFKREARDKPPRDLLKTYGAFLSDVNLFNSLYDQLRRPYFNNKDQSENS